jgi:hypothetical protein
MPFAAADFIGCGAVPDLIASTIRLAIVFLCQLSRASHVKGSCGVVVDRQITIVAFVIQSFVWKPFG